jgi:acyl-CoA reductase-like NAD-dependent aldehyde dehydrogenase
MRRTTIRIVGTLGRIARLYSNAKRAKKRWKRTPPETRVEMLADAGDLVLHKLRERRAARNGH